MNATIHGIIDHMFKDTVDNAETRALHEELLNNCMEHYDDLIGRGMSEIEAIDAVVDSLKGMKEVIDEYPKKPGTENREPEENKNSIPQIQTAEQKKEEHKDIISYLKKCYSVRNVVKLTNKGISTVQRIKTEFNI